MVEIIFMALFLLILKPCDLRFLFRGFGEAWTEPTRKKEHAVFPKVCQTNQQLMEKTPSVKQVSLHKLGNDTHCSN